MRIDRWIRMLLPKEPKFLAFFIQDVDNIVEASRALGALLDVRGDEDRARIVKAIEDCEHRGDEITHTIFRELGRTFITPLDREDIAGLASSLDDILDEIDRAATCIVLYHIDDFDDPIRDLVDIIKRQA